MATKLKNLKIRKVDFVDEGANPDAHIRMLKRRDGETQTTEEDHKKGTGSILKKMLGFIGKAAGMNQGEIDSAVDEIQKGESVGFNEKIIEAANRKVADEIWDTCYALQSSLCSILNDGELDSTGAATAMQESLDEFYAAAQDSVKEWSCRNAAGIVRKNEEVSEVDLEGMKAAVERLNDSIRKAGGESGMGKDSGNGEPPEKEGNSGKGGESKKEPGNENNQEGDEEEVNIDKSKLTDAERVFLDSIEKRCSMKESREPSGQTQDAPEQAESPWDSVSKSAGKASEEAQTESANSFDNIYKGLHPAVAEELSALKKFKEEAEDRELEAVAEQYEIIGKKKEELVPVFKSLRAAGGTAYNDMIAVLDQVVATVEKSGAFSEIGKSGYGSGTVGAAEAKIEAIAKGYMEKDPFLDYASARAKAWENNPELMDEYEVEAGF